MKEDIFIYIHRIFFKILMNNTRINLKIQATRVYKQIYIWLRKIKRFF